MTDQDKIDFENATQCLCNNANGRLLDKHQSLAKVRDLDHVTSNYRGACRSCCNLHRNNKDVEIPIFFHNLKNMMLI